MLYYVKSHKKFKILDTFNELLCYCSFALRHSIVYCEQSAVLINRLNHNIFLCVFLMFFGIPFVGLKRYFV